MATSKSKVTKKDLETSRELLDFIAASPTAFQAVENSARMLEDAGFVYLDEAEKWQVEPGGCYYTTTNGSSIMAFRVAKNTDELHFQIAASHGDSPSFKIKDAPELRGPDGYLRLNVEAYGGMIDSTWFDKPLSVAGRLLLRGKKGIERVNVVLDRDLLIIPNLAIHFNREVNQGVALNRQVDLCPLVSAGELEGASFVDLVAKEAGVDPAAVIAHDLFLWNRTQPRIWGFANEFVSAGRLDDLQCAFATLRAFLAAKTKAGVSVWVCFDNEEVGSTTKQGAMSTFMPDSLRRLCIALGKDEEEYLRAIARSSMLSCDNGHAVHPNHPEKSDEVNRPRINGGPVIKEAANQKYTTDGASRAMFVDVCERAGVPWQRFANRSDSAGGSTLGNLANTQASMDTVDIGLAQLAMHSSYETAGTKDTEYAIKAVKAYYETVIRM